MSNNENELRRLNKKRGALKRSVTRFQTYLDKEGDKASSIELRARLETHTKLLSEFEDLQFQIELISTDEDVDENETTRMDFENSYYKAISIGKEILLKCEAAQPSVTEDAALPASQISVNTDTNSNTHTDGPPGVKLPVINLPEFDGAYENWYKFRDSFNALVNYNTSLSNIQKFMYLTLSLKGSAAELIQSLQISNESYFVAIDLLKDRYENKKLIVNTHINALFELEHITRENASSLRNLLDKFMRHHRALTALKLPVDQWDSLLIHLLASKLDNNTRKLWELSTPGSDLPKLDALTKFLKERCQDLETIAHNNHGSTHNDKHTKPKAFSHFAHKIVCSLCKQAHTIYQCKDFSNKTPIERRQFFKDNRGCTNCLMLGRHTVQQCKSTRNCYKCGKRHHTLLHVNDDSKRAVDEEITSTVTAHTQSQNNHVFLSTALVNVIDKNGKAVKARALIDSGSDSNYITNKLSAKIGLNNNCQTKSIQIIGINGAISHVSKQINVKIACTYNNFQTSLNFLVIDKITERIPIKTFATEPLNIPANINLADPTYYIAGDIDILIGAEIFYDLIQNGKIELGRNKPVLQETRLGWIVTGALNKPCQGKVICNLAVKDQTLRNELQQFWNLDDCSFNKECNTVDNIIEETFVKTTKRNDDGRYIVELPFNDNKDKIGDSFSKALTRFLNTEKRLQRDTRLIENYTSFMHEYEALGHMIKVTELTATDCNEKAKNATSNHPEYFIQHHAVFKESSSTTKVRIVFDASAFSSSGISLNNALHSGPYIQDELLAILLRFRKHNIVITADIEKMFRQVLVNEKDSEYQKIIWRDHPTKKLNIYRLRTVTYGTAPATYLTTRCLKDIASRFKDIYPEAAKAIIHDTYVDDVITGCSNATDAIRLKNELSIILRDACFNLRKWSSNSQIVLADCNSTVDRKNHFIRDKGDNRTLGLIWLSETDTLKFVIANKKSDEENVVTKRSILSTTVRIFDPLGLVSPIVVSAKILIQRLWLSKLNWDDPIPNDLRIKWLQLKAEINKLNSIEVPRKVLNDNPVSIQICGFSDSSEAAYGTVIYLRSLDSHNNITVTLLCSKSRVAPVKRVSIPRLELCGALLLATLVNYVSGAIELPITNFHYFTDSTIVLNWIQGESTRWKTFVANRVSKIQDLTNKNDWYYVGSKNNPADILLRGTTFSKLNDSFWWNGAYFLHEPETTWPVTRLTTGNDISELKTKISLTVQRDFDLIERYSSLERLKKVTAYVLRFKENCSVQPDLRKYDSLSACEVNNALFVLVRIVQTKVFYKEMEDLKSNKTLSKTSKLSCLDPFLDKNGIIRVGGRIEKANIEFNNKHQIIIPKGHNLTKLVIMYYHNKHFHAGVQATLSAIRQVFWPIDGKNLVKGLLRSCIICFKYAPRYITLKMSDLPKSRVTPTRPFLQVSIDMAGPFNIKETKFRNKRIIKSYVCVFVCFVTKAVHLEIMSDLTTQNFLNCLKRFTARRGLPSHVHSDNAKAFVSANKELREAHKTMIKFQCSELISNYLSDNGVTWRFLPARAPHFGGLHEAAVKSMKTHFKKVISNDVLTVENLSTLLCQVEAILNSRPLHPISDDPNDLLALTPGHFLIGHPLTAIPQVDITTTPIKQLNLYEQLQRRLQHFWKRWSRDYLSNLQQRYKWKGDGRLQLREGDLVLIKDDNMPPQRWPLARVLRLHPGTDGRVRVAKIRTVNGETTRAAVNLCPLPISSNIETISSVSTRGSNVSANSPSHDDALRDGE